MMIEQELSQEDLRRIREIEKQDRAFIKGHTDPALVQELQSALPKLCFENGWFELVNSGVKKDYLKDMKTNEERQYKQFGMLKGMRESLKELFDECLDVDDKLKDETIGHIERIAASFATATKRDSVYIIVRTPRPTETEESFKARWHTDGRSVAKEISPKLVVALTGRSTLTSRPTNEQKERYFELEAKAWELEQNHRPEEARKNYRNKLDDFMKTEVETLCFEDCSKAILFQHGADGLVHSEPVLDRHRIYVSFVPSSARGILSWIKRCRACNNPDAPIKVGDFWKCRFCIERENLAKAKR